MNTINQQSIQQNKSQVNPEAHQSDEFNKRNTKLDAAKAIPFLRDFINPQQIEAIGDACHGEEKQFFIDKLVALKEHVANAPKTYDTDGQGLDAIVVLHYFTGNCDWYLTELDREPEQLQCFGLVNLGFGAELGYISLVELLENGAELDLYWEPKPLKDIAE
jgi:hypothetical protein